MTEQIEACLDTDYVDIYMCHRVPENIPIEETAGAMAELIKKSKTKSWKNNS